MRGRLDSRKNFWFFKVRGGKASPELCGGGWILERTRAYQGNVENEYRALWGQNGFDSKVKFESEFGFDFGFRVWTRIRIRIGLLRV